MSAPFTTRTGCSATTTRIGDGIGITITQPDGSTKTFALGADEAFAFAQLLFQEAAPDRSLHHHVATCIGDTCVWCAQSEALERAEARVAQLTLALQNTRMLAKRLRKTDPENAAHFLRFCTDAGVVDTVMRNDEGHE